MRNKYPKRNNVSRPDLSEDRLCYSTNQAAALLGLEGQTLRLWRSRGRGPRFVQLSANRVGYTRSALEKFLASREYGSTAEASVAGAR